MARLTAEDFTNTLKTVYMDPYRKTLKNSGSYLMYAMEVNRRVIGTVGQLNQYAIQSGKGGGVGAVPESVLLTGRAGSPSNVRNATFAVTNQIGAGDLESKAMKLSETNVQAFIKATTRELTDIMDSFSESTARQMAGSSKGVLSTLVAGTYTAVGGIATLKVTDVDRYQEGEIIDLFESNGTAIATGLKIQGTNENAVAENEYEIYVTSINDLVIPADAFATVHLSLNSEIHGIEEFIKNDTSTIGGIDRSTAAGMFFRPTVVDATDTPLDDTLLRKAKSKQSKVSNSYVNLMSAKHEVVDSYEATLVDQKRFIATGTEFEAYKGGMGKQEQLSHDGKPFVRDRFVTQGDLYGVSTGT